MISDASGRLTLGHVFGAAGVEPESVLALRHTYNPGGLASASDATPDKVLRYTRQQGLGNKIGSQPPGNWLVFMADGGHRARFLTAYENLGEVMGERTAVDRFFDLRPSQLLIALKDRLVVEWSKDAVNWAKLGRVAAGFPIVEIADPVEVPFPGFDRLLISFETLLAVVEDRRYAAWRTALSAVQGIYLIADDTNGQLYVGKADGGERIFGRWAAYARDGHGGNMALKQLAGLNPRHARNYRFSLLQVFGPATPAEEIDAAESHFKDALLTRTHGLNRN
ncbi:GIY-YIG nuclease family protein [Nakamurella sp. GG22]